MEPVAVPEQHVVGDRRPGLTRVVLLCTIAVAFGFAIRLPWIQWASTNDSMQWQGTVQATTYDALYHGAAIRRHVEGRLDGVDDVSGLISNHSLVQWPGMAARWLLPAVNPPYSTAVGLVASPCWFGMLMPVFSLLCPSRLWGSPCGSVPHHET